MSVLKRNAVDIRGSGDQPLVFLHGYGCDQTMWRHIARHFEGSRKVVTFDHVGSGSSDLTAYDRGRYASLDGYAKDFIDVIEACNLKDVDAVGHSVGGMIALLAAGKRPDLFRRVMTLGASPCYLNLDDYQGGFDRKGIEELLAFLEMSLQGWSSYLAPLVMGNAERPELTAELESYFVGNDPDIMHDFARVIFLSDHRAALATVTTPTLIMQCTDDIISPPQVSEFMQARIKGSDRIVLDTHGHYPHLSNPDKVREAMLAWLSDATQKAA
jgi:sigma-B regulation protein RsbQ